MATLPSTMPEWVVPVAAGLIYALIWFFTRGLAWWMKLVIRGVPLILMVLAVVHLTVGLPMRREPTVQSAPPTDVGTGGARREAAEAEAKKQAEVQVEARKAEAEAARKAGEDRRMAEAERSRMEADRKRAEEASGARKMESAPPPPPATTAPAPYAPKSPDTASRGPAPPVTTERPAGERSFSSETEAAKESPKGGPPPGVPAAEKTDWDVVPVFYGTDRARKDDAKRIIYTSDRARRLELGRALVTVPKAHQVPNIERPFAIRLFNITIYEQAEDPKQHFTLRELKSLPQEEFLALVRERVGGSSSFKDQAIVFVHGYNTEFDYALYRTAQMAYDLKFDGASFLYSWPSGGGVGGYGYDRESATQTEPYLKDFLALVLKESGAKSVSVIAHSMGNLPLLNVLRDLGPALPADVRLNQIILAAPDVDRDVFAYLAANIKQYGRGVTLYCSANDLAMAASRRVAGGIPRAGDVPADGPILVEGIDTIDVTSTSTDVLALNHSTYAEKSALLNDIGLLLLTGERPPERRIPILQKISTPKGDFWRYPTP